jgi:SAM-dependent methyltransferase
MGAPPAARPSVIDREAMPRLVEFRELLAERYRLFQDVVDRSAAAFGPEWVERCEESLQRLFPTHEALALAAQGYALFVLHLLRAQKQFEKDRRYPSKSYAAAADETYFDERYMLSEYLPGLLLSHYLWPHHYRQLRFFDYAFVSQMRLTTPTRFVEIGVGTGLYSRRILQSVPSVLGTGFDISPASAAFAAEHIRAFELQDRYEIVLKDVVAEPIAPCDWLVCVEVLEHLEDPLAFLGALRAALAPGGRAFITAALNAPHVDHIYLYERPDEVHEQLRASGFALEQCFVGAAHEPTKPDLPVPTVAAFIVV